MELAGYEFGKIVGQGGMATVYQGLQLSLSRRVAIKVLDEKLRTEDDIREAFEREALIIARLSHPNIIPVIDRGVSEQGAPCFVMEYVDGIDLSRVMREGQLGLNRKLELLLQITRALAYAHRNAVIHRDIKPSNVIVDKDWHVRVVDFGIAMLYSEINDADVSEQSNAVVMGTDAYMAPEIKASASHATALSDIYAFGVLAFELLTGHLPSRGLKPPSQFDSDISSDIDRLVLECLAPDSSRRPQRAELISERLLLALKGAHIDQQRAAKAKEAVGQKSFTLLDVLSEHADRSTYLFLETKTQHRYVVRKLPADHPSLPQWHLMAGVQLSHWVNVHGVSKNANSSVVVTDYMSGGSLSERMSSPLLVGQFLPWATQIAEGLAQAHEQDLFHGDLNESCVFFDSQSRANIASVGGSQSYGLRATTRVVKLEEKLKVDINACGALFYRMLIGEAPRYHQRKLKVGKAFSRLPQSLQTVIKLMLNDGQSSSSDRFEVDTMKRVRRQLDEIEQDLPTQVWRPEKPLVEKSPPQTEQKKWLLFLLLVLLFLVLMDVGVIALYHIL